MAVLVDDLKAKVLENVKDCDKAVVITGYFSPDIIEEIVAIGVPLAYYYGMYGVDKIANPIYDKLVSINTMYASLSLKFVHTQRVHTKCYLFYKDGNISNALIGSANCSLNGLCSDKNSEMLVELNINELQTDNYLKQLEVYVNDIDAIALDITDPLVKPKEIKKVKAKRKGKVGKLPDTGNPLSAIMPLYQLDKRERRKPIKAEDLTGEIRKEML